MPNRVRRDENSRGARPCASAASALPMSSQLRSSLVRMRLPSYRAAMASEMRPRSRSTDSTRTVTTSPTATTSLGWRT